MLDRAPEAWMPDVHRKIDIHFPKKGLDISRPAGEMPVYVGPNNERHYSCADASNVVSWDTIAERQRGGSRSGLTKYIEDLGTDFMVQELFCLQGSGYDPPGGNPVQPSFSGRVVTLVKVTEGNVEVMNPGDSVWVEPTNNASNDPPLNASGLVYAAPNVHSNQQLLYFADGLTDRVSYDPVGNTVDDWVVTPATGGAMPEDSGNGPRLICTCWGRTIQSGIISDPHNIFASAIGDANDYNYSPANPSAVDAWALNLADMGTIGDVVTGLISCTDDVLVVLCDHTIEKIVGDPQNGGSRQQVSPSIGGAWGKAWCIGPDGTIYFFSNIPGVYAMPARAAGQPVRISQQIDPRLKDVDTGNSVIIMAWDDRKQGFNLWITYDDGASGNHWFYEAVRPDGSGGGWFPVSYGNEDHNPFACCTVDGNEAGDRTVVIGGSDGYVRAIDPDATDDDGTDIESFVLIGPILTPYFDEMRVESLQTVLSEDSEDVQLDFLKGRTAEEALASDPVLKVRATISAGRGHTKLINRAGHACYFKYSGVGRWAYESGRAAISQVLSMVRRRGK